MNHEIDNFLAELDEIEQQERSRNSGGWNRLDRWKNRVGSYLRQVSPQEADRFCSCDIFADLFEEIERCRNYLIAFKDDLSKHPVEFDPKAEQTLSYPSETNKTEVEKIIARLKNHPALSPFIIVAIVIIAFGTLTDSLQKIGSFLGWSGDQKGTQQTTDRYSTGVQAGRDINITNNTITLESGTARSNPSPIARFPFVLQVRRAKERISYLHKEYLHTDTMSLIEVTGHYGDNLIVSPELYNWDDVLRELEQQRFLKILGRTDNNIEFRILRE